MQVRYSVIIPVYNADKTIKRCIDSLLCQEYHEYEILLINDGSQDESGAICKTYAKEYSQIRYIEKENGGVSSARNMGLKQAIGEYILFVDSDDYVLDHYFTSIEEKLKLFSYDLLHFGHDCFDHNQAGHFNPEEFISQDHQEIIHKVIIMMCNKEINSPCAKVYKSEIIRRYGINFTENASIAEDRAFNIKYAMHINSLRVCKEAVYAVDCSRDDSLSRRTHQDLQGEFGITITDVEKELTRSMLPQEEQQRIREALNFGVSRTIYNLAKNLVKSQTPRRDRIREIKSQCREINGYGYTYPDTRFCRFVTLPVRREMAWLIDIMAQVLVAR